MYGCIRDISSFIRDILNDQNIWNFIKYFLNFIQDISIRIQDVSSFIQDISSFIWDILSFIWDFELYLRCYSRYFEFHLKIIRVLLKVFLILFKIFQISFEITQVFFNRFRVLFEMDLKRFKWLQGPFCKFLKLSVFIFQNSWKISLNPFTIFAFEMKFIKTSFVLDRYLEASMSWNFYLHTERTFDAKLRHFERKNKPQPKTEYATWTKNMYTCTSVTITCILSAMHRNVNATRTTFGVLGVSLWNCVIIVVVTLLFWFKRCLRITVWCSSFIMDAKFKG